MLCLDPENWAIFKKSGRKPWVKSLSAILCALIAGCGGGGTSPQGLSADDAAYQQKLQEQFLDAKPGSVIEIPAGRHALDRVLTLRANGVTIRGCGVGQEHPVVQE